MYGLPDISIREAKERVKIAIKNIECEFHSRKVVINLAPADIKKEGASFDLPIAVGILINSGYIKSQNLEDTIIIGELSLDGKVTKVKGVLSIAIEAKKIGIKRIILPKENVKEAKIIQGIKIIGIESLNQLKNYLNGIEEISSEKIDINVIPKSEKEIIDFSDVKGQENVKRAIEVATAR